LKPHYIIMIDKIIFYSIKNKLIIGLLILALICAGINAMMNVKLGSVPDITNNQVQVITVAPNLGTEDIEQFVTYPVELAVANLPDVTELRSISRFGLSVVTIVFEDKMGTYLPRQLVQEKLNQIQDQIPKGFGKPFMAPIATGLGEIYQYSLVPKEGFEEKYSPTELRTIQDWIVKRQMALVRGVVEINSFGGNLKQYEIALDPNKLKSMEVSMVEVFEALEKNNSNTGGAYIEKNHQANFIRGEGLARSLDDLRNIVVKNLNGSPILVGHVADTLRFGSAVRYGAFTQDGREAVGGQVLMLKGENPNQVIKNVQQRITEIQKSLPEGLEIKPFLDRSDLIARTTSTVSKNLTEGALIVVFVLVLLLGSLRGGLVTASIIPLSLLFAFILMRATDVWANLMSLGAIDFGIIVDGAVIIVEGTVHQIESRIKKHKGDFTQKEMDELTAKAASSVMNSAFFGQLIILIVFTPILFLTGVEGKMFQPMAYTFGFAVLGALLLCLTYVPAVSSIFMKPSSQENPKRFARFEARLTRFSNKMMNGINRVYQPAIRWALNFRKTVVVIAISLLVMAGWVFANMGGEFMPKLDEGDIAMQALIKPGSSLTESIEVSERIENIITENFPEVLTMVGRIGVAEIPTDPMPMDIADCFIILEKDMDKWTSAKTKAELIEKMQEKLSVLPGVNFVFTQPVELRFNELLTGVREDVAIKLYGEDLNLLAAKAEKIAAIIQTVPGAGDVRAEATSGLPQITVKYQRNKLAQYGMDIEKLNRYVSAAFAGAEAGVIFEGEKRFDLVIRLSQKYRHNIDNLKNLYVDLPNREQVPLKELAHISYKPGPMQIGRDNTYRRVSVGVNVRGRDVESMVKEVQQRLDAELDLPPGYYITYGGSFENLQRAKARLSIVVPIALALIFILLFFALKSIPQATMIYMAVPLSAIGGIYFLWFRGMPFSISAGVGFVVLFGVAVLNGLVLISRFNSLKEEGVTDIAERIFQATKERLRPILLTAVAAIMGFMPMAVSASAGGEVQRPLATVVIGGLISATLLTLLVVPVLYFIVESRSERRRKRRGVSSTHLASWLLIGLLTLAGLGFSSQTAQAQTENLTIEQAVETALKNNPQIKAASLGVERQIKLKKTAFDLDDTEFAFSNGQINSSFIDYQWQLSQGFKIPTAYIAQSKLLRKQVTLSENVLVATENELVRNVKSTYLQLAYAQSEFALMERLDSTYSNFATAARLRYDVGETNLLANTAAQGKYQEIALQKQKAKTKVLIYSRQLQKLLNAGQEVSITQQPLNSLSIALETDSSKLAENPLLAYYQQLISVSGQQHKVQKQDFLPGLSVGYFNQQIDKTKGFSGVMFGVSLPIAFWSRQGSAQAAKINVEIASAQYDSYELELRAQFQEQFQQYQLYKAMVEYYQTQGLVVADELEKFAGKGYVEGSIDYVEYIRNLDQAIGVRTQYLNNLNMYHQTIVELNYLLGVK
jgi:heavy metal efflux system protein